MDFIKKNWEKVLLGVVLIGLAVAVAFLPLKISNEKQTLADTREQILNPKVKPLEPVNLAEAEALLKRSSAPLALDFSTGHRLFNPVLWQKTPDGGKLKVQSGKEIGPDALVITKTIPLYTTLSLESVITNDSGFRYLIGLERQAADKPADRRKITLPVSKDTKAPQFSLAGVKEVPGSLPEVILELVDSGERVTISKTAPYKRIDGYLAELKYLPENRTWPARRKDDKLTFGGADYNIVAISESEVVVSAGSGKKTTVRMTDSAR